jgi:hypothetical protein
MLVEAQQRDTVEIQLVERLFELPVRIVPKPDSACGLTV